MRTLTVIALLLASGQLCAQTQLELDTTSCEEFKRADTELNTTFSQILEAHKNDTQFVSKLKDAERAWIKFRDAELAAIYPAENKRTEYGSSYPMCNCMEAETLTKQRLEQLKEWLAPDSEGNVCAGSRNKGSE